MKRTKVLKWMLQRLKQREFDNNKGSVGEVLAVLLQSSQENAQRLADLNGIDMLLQVSSRPHVCHIGAVCAFWEPHGSHGTV